VADEIGVTCFLDARVASHKPQVNYTGSGSKKFTGDATLTCFVLFPARRRTHAGILDAASSITALLRACFPRLLDKLPRERAFFNGPRWGASSSSLLLLSVIGQSWNKSIERLCCMWMTAHFSGSYFNTASGVCQPVGWTTATPGSPSNCSSVPSKSLVSAANMLVVCRPMLLGGLSTEDLSILLSSGDPNASQVEFGAHQVGDGLHRCMHPAGRLLSSDFWTVGAWIEVDMHSVNDVLACFLSAL
jgi:hypothetical protein